MENFTAMEAMLQRRVAELEKKNELMRQLGTAAGFFKAYFSALPGSSSNEAAFNSLNEIYYDLWGVQRYSCYRSFRESLKHFKKQQNK